MPLYSYERECSSDATRKSAPRWTNKNTSHQENDCGVPVTEEREYAILFAATILSARKLINCIDSDELNLAKYFWAEKAINEDTFVMEKIDRM